METRSPFRPDITWLKDDPGHLATPEGRNSIFWLVSNYRFAQQTECSCSAAAAATAIAAAWELAAPWRNDRIVPGENEIIQAVDSEERGWWKETRAPFEETLGFLLPELTEALSDFLTVKKAPIRMEKLLSSQVDFNQAARMLFERSERRECVLILNFSQDIAVAGGEGHYAVMGAYDRERDRVLVLEVDRFGIGHYWTPADRLLESMKGMVPETRMGPRGILSFWPAPVKS